MSFLSFLKALFDPRTDLPVTYAHMSDKGLACLEIEEGVRLHAYKDTRGIWTIGTGHTSNAPSKVPVYSGMIITKAQNDALLRADLAEFEKALNADLTRPATQQQKDAMLSLEYNIGMGGMGKSSVVRDFNAGKPLDQIANDFLLWAKPPVLLARREREAAMFLHGEYRT